MEKWLTFARRHRGPLLVLAAAGVFAVAYLAAAGNGFGYYRRLSAAMLAGRLDVPAEQIDALHRRDFAPFNGRSYYPLGVLPALTLLPGVAAFGLDFPQGAVVLALAAASGWLTYVMARRLNFSERDGLGICLAVLVGSPYAYLVLRGTVFDAYLAHLLSFACLLGAVAECLGKRRWWLCGILVGLSALARPLTVLAALFFWLAISTEHRSGRALYQRLLSFTLPVVISATLIAGYNTLRFGHPLEAGYSYQLMPQAVVEARARGLFSFRHFPGNFRRAFLAGPRFIFAQDGQKLTFPYLGFDGMGMSLFLTFPLLLLLFLKTNWWQRLVWPGILTAAAIALPNLLSFATGEYQYGYRYSFDFLPFLLLALLAGLHGRLGRTGRLLMAIGIGSTAWLALPELLGLLPPA